jgi:hypothetical protein
MRAKWCLGIGLAVLLLGSVGLLTAQQPAPAAAPAQAPAFNPNALAGEKDFVVGVQPTFTWFPDAPKVVVPEGFTPIFNGENLTGWHASPTNHHGVTPDFRVVHGAIVGTQSPFGDGGILLTDKSYKNFELYMEVRPDYGCDSGIFFRSTESGHAYQITMDYLPGGSMGSLITETINGAGGTDRAAILAMRGMPPSATPAGASTGARAAAPAGAPAGARAGAQAGAPAGARAGAQAGGPGRGGTPVVAGIPLGSETPNGDRPWMKVWKREAWNTVRVRVEGDVPHVTVWINDSVVTDTQEKTNRAEGGMVVGPIAIQIHGGNRWVQAGFWRWRNIGIKELP